MTLQENFLFTNPYLQKKIMCPIDRRIIICLISPHHLIILFFCRTHHFLRYLLIIRLLIGTLIYWLLIILNQRAVCKILVSLSLFATTKQIGPTNKMQSISIEAMPCLLLFLRFENQMYCKQILTRNQNIVQLHEINI